ncbi:MAG: hypothetical protein K2O00_06025 [Muribaculaceae bacterium]|nr:hypothetical protein [Muribaculaceae bacterium]
MKEITELFDDIILQSDALDVAISEFKRMIADDSEFKMQYKEWCDEEGLSERTGFKEYAEEFIRQREEKWDSLTDYDLDN